MLRPSMMLLSVVMLGSNLLSSRVQGEAAETPSAQVTELPAFTVVGPFVRTTNANEMAGQGGKIGLLWNQFMHGGGDAILGVSEKGTIYAVYTNYESDETGAYDLVLGKSVLPQQPVPVNMKGLSIPAARYVVFPAGGSSPDAIKTAWMNVYGYFAHHPGQRRAFTYDFEQHSNTGAKIFIAIK